ncbi:MAG: PIG-L family deacetylase, partial [Thermoanaerobaculia bacterium]
AMLSLEAFHAAADPTRFPEQLKWVKPWQPKRLLWNRYSFGQPPPNAPPEEGSLHADAGEYNELLGRSYTEIAGESRSQHKSQGMGAPERRGTLPQLFTLVAGAPATTDLFEGVNTSWSRYPGGEIVGNLLQQAADTFDPRDRAKSLPILLQAYDQLDRLALKPEWDPARNPWTDEKKRQLLDVILACAGVSIDVSAADSSIVPGGSMPVTVSVVNRSDYPFSLMTVAGIYADPGVSPNKALQNNVPVKAEITIRVPAAASYSQPYWLEKPPGRGAFTVDDQNLIGLAENPPAIPLVVTLTDNQLRTLIITVPCVYRSIDAVRGEVTRNVDIVPEITANLGSRVVVFPDAKTRPVNVALRSFTGATNATVRLIAPEGWKAEPASREVKFAQKGDEARLSFDLTPSPSSTSGVVSAEVELPGGKKLTLGLTEIDYPHIPPQRVFSEASAKLVRADIRKRGNHVGYIMGAGDDVPDALRQIGYDVTLLTDADLDRGDFTKFDAVVAGVRAYNTRKVMVLAHARLMKYVENGGTYVVQYNSRNPQRLLIDSPGPYPFKVSDERVTVESAPVRLLAPTNPLLTTPNKITPEDFDGWVQERGLYFTTDWDPRYTTILATNDPNEPEKPGGELYTRFGKGVYIYTSYAWFRQLPAGVPGAYRLFANLVSAK